jgi:hypothetical protein
MPVIVPSNWVGGVYMVDVGVGDGVMPAPHGNPVNLSLLKPSEDKRKIRIEQ